MGIMELLQKQGWALFEGAMGTELQRRGAVERGRASDLACIERPDAVEDVHRAYVAAGSQVLTTNTFQASEEALGGAATVEDVFAAAVRCAREAGKDALVAADLGPLGYLLAPYGDVDEDEAFGHFARQAKAAAAAGADLAIVETMSDVREAAAAVRAAVEAGLPAIATMTFAEQGATMMGATPAQAARALVDAGAFAVGANCSTGPDAMRAVVEQMAEAVDVPIVAQPNAGLPRIVAGAAVYDLAPEQFAESMLALRQAGASLLGGCCGTTPDHIAALAAALA